MAGKNHRHAFSTDPKLLARIAAQAEGKSTANRQKLPVGEQRAEAEKPEGKRSSAGSRLQKVRERNMESRFDSASFCPDTGALTVVLAGAALLSNNIMLRIFDAKATALKKTWQERINALRYEHPAVFDAWNRAAQYPVIVEEIYITAEATCLDSESVSAGCKPIIDAFVRAGFLPDDDPRHILHPIPFTRRGGNPGVVIRFYPAPTPHGLISDAAMAAANEIPMAR